MGRTLYRGTQSMDYGFLSLLPPIVAVVMAIKSKNVILSLFCGGFVGTMIFVSGNPFLATKSIIGDYFFVQLTDSYNAGVIVLVIFIGGFIKLMEKMIWSLIMKMMAWKLKPMYLENIPI